MKSIIEEASSVAKAIEKGWTEAGKPQEFSVKVFEEATKNFIGMTTKSAKIAIFFDQRTPVIGERPKAATSSPAQRTARRAPARESAKPTRAPAPKRQEPTPKPRPSLRPTQPQEPRVRETWNDEMISLAKTWVTDTIALIGKKDAPFTIEASNYYLKIQFDAPLFENPDKDRAVFRSFAYLIMQSLRNKFKKSFRGFKVVLSNKQ